MVTLSLISMAGMMGLAVDLGYSYFVQKEAQAAADTAALASVQEAVTRLGVTSNVSGFTCSNAASNTNDLTKLLWSAPSNGSATSIGQLLFRRDERRRQQSLQWLSVCQAKRL